MNTDAIVYRRDVGGWQVRWNPAVAEMAAREGLWPGRTVAELAMDLARAEPERLLIVVGQHEKRAGELVFPGQRHAHIQLSKNAIGYLYNRAGWHRRHVPHLTPRLVP